MVDLISVRFLGGNRPHHTLKEITAMPFPHTTDRPDVPVSAGQTDIEITFEGLILLRSEDTSNPQIKICEVGVHHGEADHSLVIAISVVGGGNLWSRGGPLGSTLEMRADDAAQGVAAFIPDENPFNRSNASNDELDFRWALDLKQMHPTGSVQDGMIRPGVQLNRGILFTSAVTPRPPAMEVFRTGGGQQIHSLRRIAHQLGARVVLNDGEKLRLVRGGVELYSLPRPPHEVPPGSKYLISVSNSDEHPPTAVLGNCTAGDFRRYYHVVTNVTLPNQFEICFFCPPAMITATTDVPCMAVVQDGGWTET
jgi:hypothetical protein